MSLLRTLPVGTLSRLLPFTLDVSVGARPVLLARYVIAATTIVLCLREVAKSELTNSQSRSSSQGNPRVVPLPFLPRGELSHRTAPYKTRKRLDLQSHIYVTSCDHCAKNRT
jgi:hypothetical protein